MSGLWLWLGLTRLRASVVKAVLRTAHASQFVTLKRHSPGLPAGTTVAGHFRAAKATLEG